MEIVGPESVLTHITYPSLTLFKMYFLEMGFCDSIDGYLVKNKDSKYSYDSNNNIYMRFVTQ